MQSQSHQKPPARPPALPSAPKAPQPKPDAAKPFPWKLGLKVGAIVAGVLVLVLIAVNLVISADWLQARVAARIKEQTGRDLTVNGSTMLLFTPSPYVVITDAKITDPEAGPGSADLSVARLTISLNFGELLSRQIDAERVDLVRPVLTLRLGEKGLLQHGAVEDEPAKIHFIKAGASDSPKRRRDVKLKDVRIKDGTVNIIYGDGSEMKRVEHIDAKVSMPTIADPLIGKGRFEWKKQTVDFSFEVTTPADLKAKRPARFVLALETPAIATRFDGSISNKPHLSGKGRLSAKAHSIPSVLAWMRETPPVSSALGDGELASDVSWGEGEISFSNARFALEHASGQGQAVLTLRSPRPHVRAALALDHLDLNPFLASTGRPATGAVPKGAGNAAPKTSAPDSSAVKPAPSGNAPQAAAKPKPSNAPTDWSTKPPADFVEQPVSPPPAPQTETAAVPDRPAPVAPVASKVASPAAFDADININVLKTRVGHLDIGPSSLGLAMRDGVMNATLGGMELYGGHASGTMVIDASKPVPTFTGNFKLEGVQAKPLLSDAAQFSMIAGSTKATLTLSGEGTDADEIKSSLNGHGSLLVTDGNIEGIDITRLITMLGAGEIPDLRQGPGAKTAFSDLGGGFTISDGVAETQNMKMVSPLLKVTAEGTVDLAKGMLDILAHPQIVEGPEGQGGANDLAGLTVPVRIEGPLDDPRIKPELSALLANPETTSSAVNKIGEALQKKFKGKPVGEAIGRFLGNVQIKPRGDGAPTPKPRPQAGAAPQAGEPEQGDVDAPMDPDLEDILR